MASADTTYEVWYDVPATPDGFHQGDLATLDLPEPTQRHLKRDTEEEAVEEAIQLHEQGFGGIEITKLTTTSAKVKWTAPKRAATVE